jgi:hypothetical protein
VNDSTQAWLAGIAVGFALCAVLVLAHTAGCLTRPGYVWHVDGRVCVPERAFVPAGYAPVEVRTK